MYKLLGFFWKYNLPRWSILCIDMLICASSLTLALFLRFNFKSIPAEDLRNLPIDYALVLSVRLVSFLISKTYKGVIRYTGSRDSLRILKVVALGSVSLFIINIITFLTLKVFYIPSSFIIIDALVTMFIMISSRLAVKAIYFENKNPEREKINVLIYGAGESGIITKRTLDRDAAVKYKVFGFIDDDLKKKGRSLEGTFIFPPEKMEELIKENKIETVVISILNISASRKNEIVETCLAYNVRVLSVPPVTKWINGELSFNQLKTVAIEQLLERDPIKLDVTLIEQQLKNKIILVTGAAGSIGSELVWQILHFHPEKIILLDNSESPLHETELELSDKFPPSKFEVVMGDVRNTERMQNVFRTFKPQVVYHAAAYKHVPMMENNPSESILTNVLGTKVVAELAVEHKVEKFVLISTDKAVNPTNVMGASKRIAEIFTQALGKQTQTKFITTRFGNVLGSNGSVIPRFKKQIEQGGPVTVTHPDITRYFMTIAEACQLVLEAGCMGKGGEIFVFDMGKQVKISELAKKMIKLSGLTEGRDIQIIYTGLRPGEKLYEELLADAENTLPTHHPQILIGKVKEYGFEEVKGKIEKLITLFYKQNNNEIVSRMKELVPEFKSNNSVFEKLDN
ncbi:MAG TPA: nucleoside-diphosphate sugar epimerase/dehydratase [Bacteroidia bacterium]|jgi:FlaA1/EpsC-like NDP-sugar epimerase|nr:nucleoside-diphosphate sugar epimerase/dehydratase [Bacteroidia bacterium]